MKKLITTALILLLSAFMTFAGATGEKTQTEEKDEGFVGDFTFGGSTTVEPVALTAIEGFAKMYPKARISYEGTGSSTGVKNTLSGAYLLGGASRELKDSEKADGAYATPVALDGIAVCVNGNVPLDNLSLEQVAKIFAGEILNWKDVGGPDKAIVLVNRDEASGTRGAFLELALDAVYGKKAGKFHPDAITTESNGNMVSMVGATPDSIGYCGLAFVDNLKNAGGKTVLVDGVEPSVDSVVSGGYAISRKLNIVTKGKPAAGSIQEAFIAYLLSGEGQDIVEESGYVKLP